MSDLSETRTGTASARDYVHLRDELLRLSGENRLNAASMLDLVHGWQPPGERWWIATERFSRGGKKILGPFGSRDLALEVRTHVEATHKTDQYWVVNESE